MIRLGSAAQSQLSPEACQVVESFLAALPPYVQKQIRSVRLFGSQARRFDPEAPFELLVLAEARSMEVKTAVSIGVFAVESAGLYAARATVTTPDEISRPSQQLARLLRNAEREGIDLWVRESGPGGHA